MFVKVARRGLMGPSEAVLPTMVPDGCGAAWEAAAAAAVSGPMRLVKGLKCAVVGGDECD